MRAPILMLGLALLTPVFAGCLAPTDDPDIDPGGEASPSLERDGPTSALLGDVDNVTEEILALQERLASATGTYYSIGDTTFEPTIGATSTGGLFMNSYAGLGSGQLIYRSMDDGQSWEEVTPRLPTGFKMVPNSNDPYIFVDQYTDRLYEFDMCVTLQGFCIAYSDDDGESWTHLPPATGWSVVLDHQSVAAAPHLEGPEPTLYENVMVFCVNRLIGAWCSTSYDGGAMWTPMVPGHPVEEEQCGALHAHVTGGPDGRFYRGQPGCDGPAVFRSEDGGLTWTEHTITSEIGSLSHEITTATDDQGNLYAFWIGDDGLPYLSWSTDHAETWSEPLMVGAPGVTATGFPTLAAASEGRVAWAYIGSDVEDGYNGEPEDMNWTGYIGFSVDVLTNATLATVPVNAPEDPLQSGGTCGSQRCGGFGDFIDITIDAHGRPWAALSHNEDGNTGIVGTLASGPSLRNDVDLTPLPLGEPLQ